MTKLIKRSEFEKLEKELEFLKNEGRKEMAQKLAEARTHGDLSVNAVYPKVIEEQAKLEEKIEQLEKELASVTVVEDDDFESLAIAEAETVRQGSLIVLECDGELSKCIIDESTDDPTINSIPVDSPIGSASIGKRKGDFIRINGSYDGYIEMRIADVFNKPLE